MILTMPKGKKPKISTTVDTTESSPVDFIVSLPLPVVEQIKIFLSPEDILNLKLVCRQWLAVYQSTVTRILMVRQYEYRKGRKVAKYMVQIEITVTYEYCFLVSRRVSKQACQSSTLHQT